MNRSLLDDWSYDRVMLQLLGTAGTVNTILIHTNDLHVLYAKPSWLLQNTKLVPR